VSDVFQREEVLESHQSLYSVQWSTRPASPASISVYHLHRSHRPIHPHQMYQLDSGPRPNGYHVKDVEKLVKKREIERKGVVRRV